MIDREKWFYFAGGTSAATVEELTSALKGIPDDEFSLHVNSGKNDFANWVEHVFQEHDLAAEMRKVMEKEDTVRVLEEFLQSREAAGGKSVLQEPAPELKEGHEEDEGGAEGGQEGPREEPQEEEQDVGQEGQDQEVLQAGDEHELSKEEFEEIVDETRHELDIEGRKLEHDHGSPPELPEAMARGQQPEHHGMIVKEFIYGFLLGLIFGFILLGTLMNVKG